MSKMFDDSAIEEIERIGETERIEEIERIVIDEKIYIDSGQLPKKCHAQYLFYEKELYYCYEELGDRLGLVPYQVHEMIKGRTDLKSAKRYNREKERTRLVVDRYRVTKPYIIPI